MKRNTVLKKAVSTALSLSMLGAAAMTGFAEETVYEGDIASIIPEETVTLDVYVPGGNYPGVLVGWWAQVLKEKFNVELNLIPDQDGTVYTTRMESGNLGDLCLWTNNGDDYQGAAAKEMLLDWYEDDLIYEYAPYIVEHMQPALEKNAKISGGTTYGIGHNIGVSATDTTSFMYEWLTRWDLYNAIGAPEIKNLDDFADALIEMQKLEPENEDGKKTYAVSLFSDWDGDLVMFPKSLVTAYYGYDEFGFGFYDPEEQKFVPAVEEDSPYIEMLKFYNKLYQAGALDPDSETQGFGNCLEDYQNGVALFTQFDYLASGFNTPDHLTAGKAVMPVLPEEATPINYGQSIYGENYVWSISNYTEYPELCMAFINWMATPEGKMIQLYGPKDLCWYYDENGKSHLTEFGEACAADGETEMIDGYSGTFGDGTSQIHATWALDAQNLDSNGETYNKDNWESRMDRKISEIEQSWVDATGCRNADEYLNSRPYKLAVGSMYASTAKSDELLVTWNQVSESVKSYSWRAIYAASDEEFDSLITEMIETANAYGLAECVAYQENEAELRKAAEDAAIAASN